MAAGSQPTQVTMNNISGNLALALRNAFQDIKFFSQYLNAQSGGAQAFLVALGFTAADAAVIVSVYGNLAALEAIYEGGAQAGGAVNYQQNSNLLWGGQ